MTIAAGVLLRTRGEALRVTVNGVPMLGTGDSPGLLSLEYGDSYDTPPYANVELNTIPSWIRSGMAVEIDAGINTDRPRQFTGFISALPGEEPEFLRDKIILDGAVITVGTPPDTSQSALNAVATLTGADIRPPLPAGSHIAGRYQNRMIWDPVRLSLVAQRILTDRGRVPGHPAGDIDSQTIECSGPLYNLVRQLEFEDNKLTVGGMTDIAVIEQELDRCGITDRVLDTPPLGAYTLAADATIDGGSGIDRLADLVGIQSTSGYQFHQTPGGVTVLRAVDFFPAPTAAFTYSTNNPATAYILDTSGVSELAVTFNPTITKGMTGKFTIPHLNVDGLYFVYGVRHVFPRLNDSETAEGPTTYLRLRGGNRLGGTVSVNPVASFTFAIRRQVVGNAVKLIYTLDGSDAVSLDGTITAWNWTITTGDPPVAITTIPAHPLSGQVVTFIVTPADISGGILTSTLTVTGSNTLTHATSLELPNASTDSAVVIAPFGVAAGTRRMVSPNGGETYNDTTPSAKTATCVAARPADGVHAGHFAQGHSDGTIDVSRDFGVTWAACTLNIAAGASFNDIQWDWRNTKVCWAITTDMRLYVCLDMDVTTPVFGLYGGAGLRTTLGLAGAIAGRRCIGLPGAGGIYIFGGTGAGVPLITFDAALTNVWVKQTLTGDLATDTATPADATMRIVDATAPGDGMAHIILEWASGGGASLVAIYYSSSPPGLSAAYSRATGLTAGLKTGRAIVGDAPLAGAFLRHAMFADRSVWHTTNGIAFTETVNVLPAGYTPNDALFESDVVTGLIGMQGVYLVAAENAAGDGGIFKSTDGLATLDAIRGAGATYATPTYPPGAKPKMLAIGAPSIVGDGGGLLVTAYGSATDKLAAVLEGSGWPSAKKTVLATELDDDAALRARCLTNQIFFIMTSFAPAQAAISTDGGDTWAALALPAANELWQDFAIDAGDRIWGATLNTVDVANGRIKVWYSTIAAPTTWTESTSYSGASQRSRPIRIATHPTNQNIIAVLGQIQSGSFQGSVTLKTLDRGATAWTANTNTTTPFNSNALPELVEMVMLSNNRLVVGGWLNGSNMFAYYHDNYGSGAWTVGKDFGASATHRTLGPVKNFLGSRIFMCDRDTSGAAVSKIWESQNSAVSFEVWATTVADDVKGGIAYDDSDNALFIATDAPDKVLKMQPAASAGTFNDISTGMFPIGAYSTWQFVRAQHIAVIPR